MKTITRLSCILLNSRYFWMSIVAAVSLYGVVAATTPTVYAGGTTCGSKPSFIGLEPWYKYLTFNSQKLQDGTTRCYITNFEPGGASADGKSSFGSSSPFLLIALAVLDDLIVIAAYIAVGYTIYGGFRYMTSNGDPSATKSAQQTIMDAIIGLVIAILASAIVSFIGNQLGK